MPGRGDDILYDYRQVTQNHVDATVDLAERVARGEADQPDFVLWPENSTATDPFDDARTNSQILEASAAIGVPILVGAIVDGGPNEVLNQGIVWDPETGAGERYTKRHPVPFGEYVPLRSVFLRYNFFDRLRDVGRDMLTGTRDEPLDVGGVPVADAICFDVAYDDGITAQVSRGAELLVVQTSNATFIRTDQIDQQFAITRLRAIETGRWTAVASTNGVTGVIAPDGEVVDVAEPRTQDVLVQQVALIDTLTPATRIGAWSGLFLGAADPGRAGARPGPAAARDPARGTAHRAGGRAGGGAMTRGADGPRARRDGRADLQRGRQPRVDRRPAARGPAHGRRARRRRRLTRRHRGARRRVWRRPTRPSTCCTGTEKAGLGAAYLAGFAWALEAGYDVVGEMDADGSHQPEQLDRLLTALEGADLVIGSRWVPGGSVVNWPRRRELLSRGGNLYVRLLLGIEVRDATAGFRLFRRSALEKIDLGVRALHRLRLPDRPGHPVPARRAGRARGADRVRRAGARRLEDERRGRDRVAAPDHLVGAAGAPRPGPAVLPAGPLMAGRRRGWVGWVLVLAFIAVPLVEIYVLIQVGQVIGVWWTILILIADSLLGTWLIRREGGRAWQALQSALSSGRMPARELADGALILIGGTLMLAPGLRHRRRRHPADPAVHPAGRQAAAHHRRGAPARRRTASGTRVRATAETARWCRARWSTPTRGVRRRPCACARWRGAGGPARSDRRGAARDAP